MAQRPQATAALQEDGGGIGIDLDLVCVLSCTQSGTAATLQRFANADDVKTGYGFGEGVDFCSHYVNRTQKSVLFGKLATITVSAIGPTDVTTVLGTSAITFSSAASGPYDDEDLRFYCVAGGTIGAAGITFRYSRDGGVSWSGIIALGTATSYTIPNVGVTINFAAGTLVAADLAKAHCTAPMWDTTSLTACFTALKQGASLPRLILVCGDVINSTQLQNAIDAINDYETSSSRYSRVITCGRDRFPDCARQGVTTVSVVSAAKTYTRAAGSWITDGFQVGMTVNFGGFVNSASNGIHTIAVLTATVMTVVEATGADEPTVAGTTCTGTELKATWRTAINAIIGATPQTQKTSHRTVFGAGRARRQSPANGTRKKRPASWPMTIRAMERDPQYSPADTERGGLEGWSLFDQTVDPSTNKNTTTNGQLEQHDERSDGGLLAMRAMCLTSQDNMSGAFVALPLTLDDDNAPLSRLPVGCVGDIICTISKRETTRKLNSIVFLKDDGTIKEADAKRVDGYVLSQIQSAVLTPGKEGKPMCSDVSFAITRGINLLTPGAVTPCNSKFIPAGYFEQFATTVNVSRGT